MTGIQPVVGSPSDASPDAEPLGVLIRFAGSLREYGLPVSANRVAIAAESLGHWRTTENSEPYWPLRISFCSSEADLLRFDAAYRRWFGALSAPVATQDGPVEVSARSRETGNSASGVPGADADRGAGNATDLSTRDFDDMTDEQLREVSAWTELLRPAPRYRAMRRRPARSGEIDPARTMRLMLRDYGELLHLQYRRSATRPRHLLLLVDVSASMRPYSDVLLHFGHAALAANPRTAEVFAGGTRFTQLTGPLRARRIDLALRTAGAVPADWAKGTTLGVALRDFLRRWGGSRAVRSAIVVLGSDGFEFADPALLTAQVTRLAALARTVIWVDPAHRDPSDRPVDGHVARAQAQASTVLGCHSYEALRELARVITNA